MDQVRNTKITKAMVLCAGLGTRLLPITEKCPKPLVKVLNVPNLVHTLLMLRRAGIRDVIVNVFHLHQQIEDFLGDGRRWGMSIHYSRETVLLGTGGGLKKAEPFFGGAPLVLANCDFVTDVDLTPFIAQHAKRRSTATMILLKDEELQPFYSKVGVDRDGHLCSLPRCQTKPPAETGIFTGIHILENEVFGYLKEEPCGINEILYPHLMKERPHEVAAEFMTNYWCDTGDLPTFWATSMRLLEKLAAGDQKLREILVENSDYVEKRPGVWMPRQESLPQGVEILGPVLLAQNARIASGARLGPSVILGEDAEIGEGATLAHFVGLGAPKVPPRRVSDGVFQFGGAELPLKKAAP